MYMIHRCRYAHIYSHAHTHSRTQYSAAGFIHIQWYEVVYVHIFHLYVFAYLAYIRHLNSNTDILFEYLHLLIDFGRKRKKSIWFPCSITNSDQCKKNSIVLNSKKTLLILMWKQSISISSVISVVSDECQFKKNCSKVEFFSVFL